MKISILWIALLGLSMALQATAQKPKAEIPVIGETIDVRVVNVEAVVTNPSGQRVPGLSTADFRLLVDGRFAKYSASSTKRPGNRSRIPGPRYSVWVP